MQSSIEYQTCSLIEFLLGRHELPGWLDAYSVQGSSRVRDALQPIALENHAAAA